jgi:hypothetical protein
MLISTELLRLSIAKATGKTPPKDASEAELHELLRLEYEAKLEADDPIAGYDQREREAVQAALPEQN